MSRKGSLSCTSRRLSRAFQALLLLGGLAACGAGEMPVPMEERSELPALELPVEGTWRVLRSPGHERFAFDLAAVDGPGGPTLARSRLRHAVLGVAAAESHGWERPVRAPVSGRVVLAGDGSPDRERLHLLRDIASIIVSVVTMDPQDVPTFAGNFVVLRAEGFYVFLAHLREGSVRVTTGDRVEVGEVIGQVGNSGLSLEPHLHLQLFDQLEDLNSAEAPPFLIDQYERFLGDGWAAAQQESLQKGDVVRSPRPGA